MYIFNRFLNSLINKLTWIALILFIGLICFFTGLWITDAATEVSDWRTSYSSTRDSDVLNSNPTYTYEEYDSDSIRDFIFNIYNEKFYEDTITINEFYDRYNYVVLAYSSTTIRIFMQDYYNLMNYQGLSPIEGNETKFFFYNQWCWAGSGSSAELYGSYGLFYNVYIDINYNTMSYTISNEIAAEDVYYYNLANITYGNSTFNFKLLDSYNNNFAFVEQFSTSWQNYNTIYTMNSVPSYYSPSVFYSLPTLPKTGFSATPPGDDTGGGGSTDNPGVDLGGVEDKLDKIEGTLTDDNTDNAEQTGKDFFENFEIPENGALSSLITTPINFLTSLLDSNNTCTDLRFNISFLNKTKDVSIPNGCSFWNKVPESVVSIFHVLIYGLVMYRTGLLLYKTYEKFKHPEESEVQTLDL